MMSKLRCSFNDDESIDANLRTDPVKVNFVEEMIIEVKAKLTATSNTKKDSAKKLSTPVRERESSQKKTKTVGRRGSTALKDADMNPRTKSASRTNRPSTKSIRQNSTIQPKTKNKNKSRREVPGTSAATSRFNENRKSFSGSMAGKPDLEKAIRDQTPRSRQANTRNKSVSGFGFSTTLNKSHSEMGLLTSQDPPKRTSKLEAPKSYNTSQHSSQKQTSLQQFQTMKPASKREKKTDQRSFKTDRRPANKRSMIERPHSTLEELVIAEDDAVRELDFDFIQMEMVETPGERDLRELNMKLESQQVSRIQNDTIQELSMEDTRIDSALNSKSLKQDDTLSGLIYEEMMIETKIVDLPGEVLGLISEFLIPEEQQDSSMIPFFAQTCRGMYTKYAKYKVEFYQIQSEILNDQVIELKEAKKTAQKAAKKEFKLSKDLERQFNKSDMIGLARKIIDMPKKVNDQEFLILKLYFGFMGRKISSREKVFLKQCQIFFKDNLHMLKSKMSPLVGFNFSAQNMNQVKKMFIEIEDPESVFFPKSGHSKQMKLFVSILLQGLEYADLLPSAGSGGKEDFNNEEIQELENTVEFYKEIETTFSLYLSLID